ncbi:MAG: hypothetical protein PG977_000031 [Bartonella clarridgeiae]|nr:MAG: hypothetical protein PG977_000031 [Bartonella clarridgeiae]
MIFMKIDVFFIYLINFIIFIQNLEFKEQKYIFQLLHMRIDFFTLKVVL